VGPGAERGPGRAVRGPEARARAVSRDADAANFGADGSGGRRDPPRAARCPPVLVEPGPDVRGQPGPAGRRLGSSSTSQGRADPIRDAGLDRASDIRALRLRRSWPLLPQVPRRGSSPRVRPGRGAGAASFQGPSRQGEVPAGAIPSSRPESSRGQVESSHTGRGAAWLARLTGGQKVGGSNPPGPTSRTAGRNGSTGRGHVPESVRRLSCQSLLTAPT